MNPAVTQNGTLKRKRDGSGDPTSPVSQSSAAAGKAPRPSDEPDMERSQKRTQRILDHCQDASLQNGSHPMEERQSMASSKVPGKACGSSKLSPEIWQHVFSFVPPVFLGRLLRVNRAFNKILTPVDSAETPPPAKGALPFRSADFVWAASRQRFCPGLPKSVPGLNNLQMWRLLRGNNCQICGAKKPLSTTHASPDPWQSGPGSGGVRVFWAFGIRSCGPCMREASEKVMFLYLLFDNYSDMYANPGSNGTLLIHVSRVFDASSHVCLHFTIRPLGSFQRAADKVPSIGCNPDQGLL